MNTRKTSSSLIISHTSHTTSIVISDGVVSGVFILPPDFPENRENWPYFWGEN